MNAYFIERKLFFCKDTFFYLNECQKKLCIMHYEL